MTYRLEETAHAMADVLAAATLDDLSDRYLDEVGSHVPSFARGVYLHSDGPHRPSFIEVRGLGSYYTHSYEKHGRPTDPVVGAAIASGQVVDSSLISDDEWARSAAVEGVFRDHDMGHLLCAPFHVDGRFGGTLNLARHPEEPSFDEHDRTRMAMVAALFSSGVVACRRLETARRDIDVCRSALDHCEIPMIVTDLAAVERRPNLAARRLLGSTVDPWPRLGPALDVASTAGTVELETSHGDRLEVRINSVRLPVEAVVLSILQPLGPGGGVVPGGIADLLTTREIEVAGAVAAGLRDADVARSLRISHHTVKHHLKSVYRKLDVHTRVELVRRLQGSA